MIIKKVQVKSIITKSNLPASDFVINPYTGCENACVYCYARFMKRFFGHSEGWGDFVDIKINAPDLIPKNKEKYKNKTITIGSVTDAYQRVEEKYGITRKILEKLATFESRFNIITKSALISRDTNLLQKIKNLQVAFSIAFYDDEISKKFEPGASPPSERIEALKKLHDNNIRTAVFVSPIFPGLSDWKRIILQTKKYADEYWFENLNIYPSIKNSIYNFFQADYPRLINEYREIYKDSRGYWDSVQKEIELFCKREKVKYKIYFHHSDIRKNK